MGYYLDSAGMYYVGDRIRKQDVEVPPRPSDYHTLDGKDWIEDAVRKKADEDLILLDKMIQEEIKLLAIESLTAKGKL